MHLNIRKVSLFGLPLAAVILGVILMSWGLTPKAHAQSVDVVDLNIAAPGCSSTGTPTAKCEVGVGASVTVVLNLVTQPALGWSGYDAQLDYAGVINYVDCPPPVAPPTDFCTLSQGGPNNWPGCAFATGELGFSPGQAKFACANATGTDAMFVGQLASLDFQCKSKGQGTITLTPGNGATDIVNSAGVSFEAQPEALTINCVNAPTATPVPPTSTPPPQPRVQKLPVLQNVFLTRQGAKIPPVRCEDGTDVADLNESINIPITSPDPKDPSVFQQLGAFQFELRFDEKMVCVSVDGGLTSPNLVCSTVTAKGLVRFGCVSIGKGNNLNDQVPATPLAIIHVRPQEELYSQIRPNQSNGIPVQIMNQLCQLSDDQGLPIPIFSCEDADITFRFLEGDVDADCDVDVLDAQAIAFRWGAIKGNLLFNSFMDLSPSGHGVNGDGRIHIGDLQFVFGRIGSLGTDSKGGNGVCTGDPEDAWPLQPPVNPKA